MRKNDLAGLQYGSKKALQSIIEIGLLAVIKMVIGFSTGLIILIADALASFADLISLFASYIGLKICQRGADKSFKYGYYKVETFAGFIVSLVIIYFGYRILRQSLERIYEPGEAMNHGLVILSVTFGILAPIHVAGYLRRAAKKINSIALRNAAKDQMMDIGTQIVVMIGAGANFFRIPYLEGALGVFISLMTLKMGLESAKESVFFLLDYFDDQKLLGNIKELIKKNSKIIKDIKNVRLRRAGPFIFGEAFVEVNPYAEAGAIRNDLNNLQELIAKADSQLRDFRIYIFIPHPSHYHIAVPVKDEDGLNSRLALNFAETKAYLFAEIKQKKIKNFYLKPFNLSLMDFNGIVEYLKKEQTHIVVNNNMHSLLFYHLRHLNHINIYPGFENVNDARQMIKLLIIDI